MVSYYLSKLCICLLFTFPLLKITRLGEKNGKEIEFSERDFMIWWFLCSLRCSSSRQVSTQVSAHSESAPAAHCSTPDLCPISRSQSNPLLFPQGDYGVGQMASRMHLGTAVASAHSSQRHTQTCTNAHAQQTQTHQSSSKHQQLSDNPKGTWLHLAFHRCCPVVEVKY